jgi:hypothetical protein
MLQLKLHKQQNSDNDGPQWERWEDPTEDEMDEVEQERKRVEEWATGSSGFDQYPPIDTPVHEPIDEEVLESCVSDCLSETDIKTNRDLQQSFNDDSILNKIFDVNMANDDGDNRFFN